MGSLNELYEKSNNLNKELDSLESCLKKYFETTDRTCAESNLMFSLVRSNKPDKECFDAIIQNLNKILYKMIDGFDIPASYIQERYEILNNIINETDETDAYFSRGIAHDIKARIKKIESSIASKIAEIFKIYLTELKVGYKVYVDAISKYAQRGETYYNIAVLAVKALTLKMEDIQFPEDGLNLLKNKLSSTDINPTENPPDFTITQRESLLIDYFYNKHENSQKGILGYAKKVQSGQPPQPTANALEVGACKSSD